MSPTQLLSRFAMPLHGAQKPFLRTMPETILITGVSSGLGYGLADHYLNAGAAVYGCSRREPTDLVERGLKFSPIDLASEATGRTALATLISEQTTLTWSSSTPENSARSATCRTPRWTTCAKPWR